MNPGPAQPTPMQNEYLDRVPEDLLAALEEAGQTPSEPLLHACLERRAVHAGLLLIAFRDERALPLVAEVLRDEEHENLLEWLDFALAHFGSMGVEAFLAVLRDARASPAGRLRAVDALVDIARQHPAERERIVETLRARLPLVDADGRFVTPPPTDEDHVELWTQIANGLLDLQDRASQPRVLALYRADLIDEMVMGDEPDYLAAFDKPIRTPESFDLIRYYHPRRR